METTMAATPKARLATGSTPAVVPSAPPSVPQALLHAPVLATAPAKPAFTKSRATVKTSSAPLPPMAPSAPAALSTEQLAPLLEPSGILAFPVPPPPVNTARMMPAFAFPPMSDPNEATRAQDLRAARLPTVRVRPRRSSGPVSDVLANLASFVENVPLPSLPENVWSFIRHAWFFVAGTTMGVLLALALIAITGPRHANSMREARTATAAGTARVLVVQRADTANERGVGALAQNDVDDVTPSAPPVPMRRTVVVARRPATAHRTATHGKDILNAGL
jgi:hypothetical protein